MDVWNSTMFVTAHSSKQVIVWNSACQQLISVYASVYTRAAKFVSTDTVAIGTDSGRILLLNPLNGLAAWNSTMLGHSGQEVMAMEFDGITLMSGGKDGCVFFWTYQQSVQLGFVTLLSNGWILSMRLYASNQLLVGSGQNIYMVNVSSRTVMYSLTGHTAQVNSLDFNMNLLFSASTDYTVRVWNLTASNGNQSLASKNFNTGVFSVLSNLEGKNLKKDVPIIQA
jgi:WD40 repeat protein